MDAIKMAEKLPKAYDPLKDEVYMSPNMLLYFKLKLEEDLEEVLQKFNQISHSLMEAPIKQPDNVDEGVEAGIHFMDFTLQEHENQLRIEIEEALQRMKEGNYGYCKDTGEPIGVKRLLSVPTAKYSIDVQKMMEREY